MPKGWIVCLPGRVPPHDLQAESAALAATMLDESAIESVFSMIGPGDFYGSKHRILAGAIAHLHEQKTNVDSVTISARLKETEHSKHVDGLFLAEVMQSSVSSANVSYYVEIIRECSRRRALIGVGIQIAEQAHAAILTPGAIRDMGEKALKDAVPDIGGGLVRIGDILPDLFSEMAAKWNRRRIAEIPTSLLTLDTMIAGLQRKELTTIAARPSVGKSAFALGALLAASFAGKAGALFSLEMSRESLIGRMLSMLSHVDSSKMLSGFVSHDDMGRLVHVQPTLAGAPIWIDDTTGRHVHEIRSAFRSLKSKVPELSILVVDYLQNIRRQRKDADARHEIGEILESLRDLGKELDVAIVVMSQLRRPANDGWKQRPNLFELKETARIEELSDTVVLLHRPDMLDGGDTAEIIVAKHRNGPTGIIRAKYLRSETRFVDLSAHEPRP